MSDRRFYALALIGIALIGGVCMVVMQASKVEIDRGFADRLILFLGGISAAFIFMLKSDKSAEDVSRKVENLEQKVERHHQALEAKVDVNTTLTAATKQTLDRIDGIDVRKEP